MNFNFVLKSGLLSQRIHKNSLKREMKKTLDISSLSRPYV
jgi:hypothetical protein